MDRPPLSEMNLNVRDPAGLVNNIALIEQTEKVLVFYMDLTAKGKRAELDGISDEGIEICKQEKDTYNIAVISFDGMDDYLIYCDGSKYSFVITCIKKEDDITNRNYVYFRE